MRFHGSRLRQGYGGRRRRPGGAGGEERMKRERNPEQPGPGRRAAWGRPKKKKALA